MKIAYIAASVIPSLTANSIHVMKMCQAMTQEGHRTVLFAPFGKKESDREVDIWHHYGISEKFEIRHLPISPMLRGYDYMIRALWEARLWHPDMIYTRSLTPAFFAARTGMPVIYEAHNLPMGRTEPICFRLLLKNRNLLKLVVKSDALRKLYQKKYALNYRSILVAHDAVDSERFSDLPEPARAREQIGLEQKRFTIGYAGHFYSGRGIELILELAENFPDILFLMLGGHPEDIRAYRDYAEKRRLSNVRFQGFICNAELPIYLAACEVLLMPYQRKVAVSGGGDTAAFMSPMKMFEYMACQRLIISSDLPALREVFDDSNAVLCDPENIADWQSAVSRAVTDTGWRDSLGKNAGYDVQYYTWRKRVSRILSDI